MSGADLFAPAHVLARRLRDGDFSAADLLDATLARIGAANPTLNAVVTLDANGARAMARESDRRLKDGSARPLEGLPMTVKDAFDVAGIRSTAGAPAYRDRVPDRDAAAVARLRAAGAVILGKTNVPPFSGDFQTANPIFGRTNNPYDLARSPGGSSGGAAAALASGMTALELGSDLAGSIRWPAHACGLFGLKPTWGLVSTRGQVPPPPGVTAESDLVVAGPLARSAADLDLMLSVIAGPPQMDGVAPRIDPPRRTSPEGLRVALWTEGLVVPTQRAVVEGVEEAAAKLASAGALVDSRARPEIDVAAVYDAYSVLCFALVAAGLPAHVRDRIAAAGEGMPPGDRSYAALQARGARLEVETWKRIQRQRAAVKTAFAAFFERFDIILMPPAPILAMPHQDNPDRLACRLDIDGVPTPYFDMMGWAALATFAHLPAAVAPVTPAASGLPRGVQIMTAEGADRTVIAVAGMVETLCGGFSPPPGL